MLAHSFFDRIIIKVAGNQDRHKSSDQFDFGPDQTTHFGVTCPWMTKMLLFRTSRSLRPVVNFDQILCVASLGLGKGCIMFWGRLDQNSGVHGNRNPPLTYNEDNGVSTFFLVAFDPIFFILVGNEDMHKISDEFECRPDRTNDYGTTELAALERLKTIP